MDYWRTTSLPDWRILQRDLEVVHIGEPALLRRFLAMLHKIGLTAAEAAGTPEQPATICLLRDVHLGFKSLDFLAMREAKWKQAADAKQAGQ